MAVYLTGDMHADLDDGRREYIQQLKPSDILIVLGDFGYTWNRETLKKYSVPCKTLVVDGNHDNFTYLDSCTVEDMYGSKVQVIKENVYRLLTGSIYDIEGYRFFVFGGASSIDKAWRTPYKSWWPEEIPSNETFQKALNNLKEAKWSFDFFLSHTCSEQTCIDFFHYPSNYLDPVEKMISEIEYNISSNNPDSKYLHFFGHHHFNKAISREVCLYKKIVKLVDNNYEYVC